MKGKGSNLAMHRQQKNFRNDLFTIWLLALCLIALLLISPLALAQHSMHNMQDSGNIKLVSVPGDDEVFVASPESILLHFDTEVLLVKLVLREPSQGKEPINIGFRFSPERGVHFLQPLPELAKADYYLVEWAAFDANNTLVKGSFHFSFGADARPPSYYLEQLKHPDHIMSPDYRLL